MYLANTHIHVHAVPFDLKTANTTTTNNNNTANHHPRHPLPPLIVIGGGVGPVASCELHKRIVQETIDLI